MSDPKKQASGDTSEQGATFVSFKSPLEQRPPNPDCIYDHPLYASDGYTAYIQRGRTIRDYFMGCIITGLVQSPAAKGQTDDQIVERAGRLADAVMRERAEWKKRQEQQDAP